MRAQFLMFPLALAACGMDENDFVVEYTNALCQHRLACSDPAVLRFDGILDADTCYEATFNDVGAWGAGCRYKATLAEDCLEAMQTLTCPPAEGQLADRPTTCEAIYFDCPPVSSDDPTSEPSDTDAAE